MAKNSKQSKSILTKCFRSIESTTSNSNMTTSTSPLFSIIETIQTIDQMVQATDNLSNKQKGDSYSIEQIEQMLVKWTHIARFLIDTYQQIQIFNEQ